MKSWRVKFRNFLCDFPVHYAALSINRTINNNYDLINALAILMMDFDATKATLFPGTLPTLNLPIKSWLAIFHQGSCVFCDVILLTNYRSYKAKTIKLLPYHSFCGGHIPPKKNWAPFPGSPPQKNTKPPGSPFSSIPLKNFKLTWVNVG